MSHFDVLNPEEKFHLDHNVCFSAVLTLWPTKSAFIDDVSLMGKLRKTTVSTSLVCTKKRKLGQTLSEQMFIL